ncbi:MAG: four helix bundle suffix domain-containing protein [Bacteroidaceae bacterium]|nr:four helix bundle suffix domain-containing protein [Bacteroidaceae bacterium]
MAQGFLQQRGGYRQLRVYLVTEIIYDLTYHFAHRFLVKGDRTIDQMEQAARSGKQNIAEGSKASMTSRETEIKLTNVAKASLEELLIDYEDYLRVRGLCQWDNTHPRYAKMRDYAQSETLRNEYRKIQEKLTDEELANLCITLIHQATYMLRKLIERQEEQFLKEGGIREQMTKARLEYRRIGQTGQTRPTSQTCQTSPIGLTCQTSPTSFSQ